MVVKEQLVQSVLQEEEGKAMLTYVLNRGGETSLYEQLYRALRADIESGALAAGARLPSKRAFAKHLGVSVVTVEGALDQLVAEGGTYIDETLSGTLEVVVGKDAILMDMAKPQTFQRLETPEELEELYRIMGLSADGQGAVTGKPELMLLPQKVSTGLTDIMMPVADEAELEKIAPDFPALTEYSRRYNVVGVHAFTVNTAGGMIHARNFAPLYDIDEEAATGTSNGALIYYLYRHGLVELDKVYTVVQGEKMGRPSMISAQVILKDGQPFVKVGGPAVTLVRGEIEL